ncbi:7232_t:CDS:2 [Funneliformis geosporum]|uniref:7232_t:CDS:1 n=1 Tax=Funneliformis geosporum TaxID=1117311 RepID=A0A9W4SXK0_9GLOM|nr:7232_t:CDS:2 [Funneliformis geosporum]
MEAIATNVFIASSIIDTDALQEVSSKAGGITFDTGTRNDRTGSDVSPTNSPSDGLTGKSNRPTDGEQGLPNTNPHRLNLMEMLNQLRMNQLVQYQPMKNRRLQHIMKITIREGFLHSKKPKKDDTSDTNNNEVTKDTTTSDTTMRPVTGASNSTVLGFGLHSFGGGGGSGYVDDTNNKITAVTLKTTGQETITSKESGNDLKIAAEEGIGGAEVAITTSTDGDEKDITSTTKIVKITTTSSDDGVEHITRTLPVE